MANEKRLIPLRKRIIYAGDVFNSLIAEKKWSATEAADFVKELRTVDAAEVVHGRWVVGGICNHVPYRMKSKDKWVVYKCSVCGYSNGRKRCNYCPNCGAKMDGGNEDV